MFIKIKTMKETIIKILTTIAAVGNGMLISALFIRPSEMRKLHLVIVLSCLTLIQYLKRD